MTFHLRHHIDIAFVAFVAPRVRSRSWSCYVGRLHVYGTGTKSEKSKSKRDLSESSLKPKYVLWIEPRTPRTSVVLDSLDRLSKSFGRRGQFVFGAPKPKRWSQNKRAKSISSYPSHPPPGIGSKRYRSLQRRQRYQDHSPLLTPSFHTNLTNFESKAKQQLHRSLILPHFDTSVLLSLNTTKPIHHEAPQFLWFLHQPQLQQFQWQRLSSRQRPQGSSSSISKEIEDGYRPRVSPARPI